MNSAKPAPANSGRPGISSKPLARASRRTRAGWFPRPDWKSCPHVPLHEPARRERLQWETDLFGFAVSGHPLELFRRHRLGHLLPRQPPGRIYRRNRDGLRAGRRAAHPSSDHRRADEISLPGRLDGIIETELFAQTYKSYGLATVRYPVLEIEARVEPFENRRGFSLRVLRAGKPRRRCSGGL